MIVYNSSDKTTGRVPPSKGNQAKINLGNLWYKMDYMGYEGASEYIASEILRHSNVTNFVKYDLEIIEYNGCSFNGCVSKNFLLPKYSIVTIEQIIQSVTKKSSEKFLENKSTEERIKSIVDLVQNVTGLSHFGEYLTTILELDALLLNEDRHLYNIAVLNHNNGTFDYCPIFDNGASFLSDTSLDFSLDKPIGVCLKSVKAKPFSTDFQKQKNVAEKLYGPQLQVEKGFQLSEKCINKVVQMYGDRVANRIFQTFIFQQKCCAELFAEITKSLIWCPLNNNEKQPITSSLYKNELEEFEK